MKKGDASMVATVLLIVMAIVVGVLVMSFSRESEKKVEKKIINLGSSVECQDVGVGLEIDTTGIKIKNKGTLGIDKVILRKYASGGTINNIIIGASGADIDMFWDDNNIKLYPNQVYPRTGYVHTIPDPNFNKIEFIPVIIVNNEELGCENKIVTWKSGV